jgi:hypothetical protein
MSRLALGLAAIASITMMPAASALAGTARVVRTVAPPDSKEAGTTLVRFTYVARSGERNRLTLTFEGGHVRVVDLAGVTPGSGCTREGAHPEIVSCFLRRSSYVGSPDIKLGDRADHVRLLGRSRSGFLATGETVVGPVGGVLRGGPGGDVLRGGPGVNLFYGGSGNDRMLGGASTDQFFEGSARNGADTIFAGRSPRRGSSLDAVLYTRRRNPVRANLDARPNDGERGERDRIMGVADLFGGRGADRLAGDRHANSIDGDAGADRLLGHGGDDDLSGGSGSDLLVGGAGGDVVLGEGGADSVYLEDGFPDYASCGTFKDEDRGHEEFDRLYIDGHDFFSNLDPVVSGLCDEVTRSGGPAGLVFWARIGTTLTLDGASVQLPVGCPTDAAPRCPGAVTLSRGSRVLAEVNVNVPNGETRVRYPRLPRDVRAIVRRRGALGATATTSFPVSGGSPVVRRTRVTFVPD